MNSDLYSTYFLYDAVLFPNILTLPVIKIKHLQYTIDHLGDNFSSFHSNSIYNTVNSLIYEYLNASLTSTTIYRFTNCVRSFFSFFPVHSRLQYDSHSYYVLASL